MSGILTFVTFLSVFSLTRALAYPSALSSDPVPLEDRMFIMAAIGDSWGSGVHWNDETMYDKGGCMRYKFAWSTIVNASYAQWAPDPNKESGFEFQACAGAHLGDMKNQMDELTRPKVVLMEAGGNDADFYPMADACLFHRKWPHKYGKRYEEDSAKDPQGECRKEIQRVRGTLTEQKDGKGVIQGWVEDTINTWRSHPSVYGNDASLFLLGYARFFGPDLDTACENWSFCVAWEVTNKQYLNKEMRKEFNELVSLMNTAIRQAVDIYDDPKIRYIDMDPAFQGHRFCEPGHNRTSQFNWNTENVHLWNSPAQWIVTITDENENTRTTYADHLSAPVEVVDKLIDYQEEEVKQGDDREYTLTFRNPEHPELFMEWMQVIPLDSDDTGGLIARTLHPTQLGHKNIGNIVAQVLKMHYHPSDDQTVDLGNCPSGCTCAGAVPLCS